MHPRAPRPVTTLLLLCAAPALAAASPGAPPRPAPPAARPAPPAEPPAGSPLRALRGELARHDLAEARAQRAHFRPLCDEAGYPLVGNIVSKGVRTSVSAFCADVRTPPREA